MSEPKPLTEKELHTDIGSDGCWDCVRHNRNKYDLDEKHFLLVDVLGALEGLKKELKADLKEAKEMAKEEGNDLNWKWWNGHVHALKYCIEKIDEWFPVGKEKKE